jgi:D-alanyl-lipoteichoic acid acyltransferase DltB (MBOAT superfamily)
MAFTSLNFLLFFPVLVVVFYLTPPKMRWITLLVASFFFYINIKPVYALLLSGVIGSTYIFTLLISKSGSDQGKTLYMVLNIILVLLPLFFFKYFTVANNHLIATLENFNIRWPLPEIKYLLPIGISFYTFMAIGYTIDVYNEEIEAERNIGLVALFISFFPLILSGPIERAKNIFPQIRHFHPIKYDNISAGLKMMLWGYFMKLVVADRIGIYVDVVYGNVTGYNGTSLLIASVLYPFQVYADLGGYSLIAIGTARLVGLNVIQNFNRPFFATSMAEFWRRWHISLISWLTDYIYTPLSFKFRKYRIWGIILALMLTFLISGIWHGAAWTFVAWGLMQGLFLSFEALTNRKRTAFESRYNLDKNFLYIIGCILTTFVLFASSQVVGRAATLNEGLMIFVKIITEQGSPYLDLTTLFYSVFGILIILLKDFKDEYFPGSLPFFSSRRVWIRYPAYLSILFIILLFGVFKGNSFIYFQF